MIMPFAGRKRFSIILLLKEFGSNLELVLYKQGLPPIKETVPWKYLFVRLNSWDYICTISDYIYLWGYCVPRGLKNADRLAILEEYNEEITQD